MPSKDPVSKTRFGIFISSTDDPIVREYRLAARSIVEEEEFEDKWYVVEMSKLNPETPPPRHVCEDKVLSCGVYIGILGPIYGSVWPDVDRSGTEHEYTTARDADRHIGLFLLPMEFLKQEPLDLIMAQTDYLKKRLADFREAALTHHTAIEVPDLNTFKDVLRRYLRGLPFPPGPSIQPPPTPPPTTFLGGGSDDVHDRRPVLMYKLNDLDSDLVNAFLRSELAQTALGKHGLTRALPERQLAELGLVNIGGPSLGSFLCFAPATIIGDKPIACKLYTVVYDGSRRGSSHKARPIEHCDNLVRLYDIGMDFFRTHLRRMGDVGQPERDELEVPVAALREALANALVHRRYDGLHSEQPTRIEVYDDRVEVISFGGLVDGVSLDELNENPDEVVPRRRNPVIAQIFLYLTLVELGGSGIARMMEAARKADLPKPKIIQRRSVAPYVKVILYRPPRGNTEALTTAAGANSPRVLPLHANALISSTVADLPAHRKAAIDAVWRSGLYPMAMEKDRAEAKDAASYSLQLIDEADIYIGIFGFRYGKMVGPEQMSITEMEYRRAKERGIPILVFLMDEKHLVRPSDVETDAMKRRKLDLLKQELGANNVVNHFRSPDDLGGQIIQGLASITDHLQSPHATSRQLPDVGNVHALRVNALPIPPAPYLAHPYILTHQFCGRKEELEDLDTWAVSPAEPVLVIQSIGGQGKSSLTWHWLQTHAPKARPDLAGVMWWSFYESGATVNNFIRHALAYVTASSLDQVDGLDPADRKRALAQALRTHPYLLVLDGLERILVAYGRLDAPYRSDRLIEQTGEHQAVEIADEVGTAQISPSVRSELAVAPGSEIGEGIGVTETERLRRCADPLDGEYLRTLLEAIPSKVLISTRLVPDELLNQASGMMVPGTRLLTLGGLAPNDGVTLWHLLGVRGDSAQMRAYLQEIALHPLLINLLAQRIVRYHPAPGDFTAWLADEGYHLRLTDLDLVQRRTHILQYAFDGLTPDLRRLMCQVAAFRYPVDYAAIAALNPYALSSETLTSLPSGRSVATAQAQASFHRALNELEERGLLHWDRATNRYDLHPVVRSYAFEQLHGEERTQAFQRIRHHFEALPPEPEESIQDLADLRHSLEIYNALLGASRLDEAARFYGNRLHGPLLYRLGSYPTIVELLTPLFTRGLDEPPDLTDPVLQSIRVTDLSTAFAALGEFAQTHRLNSLALRLKLERRDLGGIAHDLQDLALLLQTEGQRATASRVLELAGEAAETADDVDARAMQNRACVWTYLDLGRWTEAEAAYEAFCAEPPVHQAELWHAEIAHKYAELCFRSECEASVIKAAVQRASHEVEQYGDPLARLNLLELKGEIALHDGLSEDAVQHWQQAIALSLQLGRGIGDALAQLACARAAQGQSEEARALVSQAREEALDYPPHITLAEVYVNLGEPELAHEHALAGYQEAWGDGAPYIGWTLLTRARRVLATLGKPEPALAVFDASRVRPIPFETEVRTLIDEVYKERTMSQQRG